MQYLNDDFDLESESQPVRLDADNVNDADLVDTSPPKRKQTTAKVESKTVKKFQPRKRIKSADSQQLGDNEKYLVDKLVRLEETRMEQQLKIERERMEKEQAQH